jgi:hypothetical protein
MLMRRPKPIIGKPTGQRGLRPLNLDRKVSEIPREQNEDRPAAAAESELTTEASRGLTRFWWSLTTAVCLVAGVIALIDGYHGYALVAFAVTASAAINLR